MRSKHSFLQITESRRQDCPLWPSLLAGLAGGLAGTWVMTQFQTGWSKVSSRLSASEGSSSDEAKQEQRQHQEAQEESEPATTKAAAAISSRLFHHELTPEQKQLAGPAMHYGFGTAMGGVYGALAAFAPAVTRGAGMPFAAALWAAADEVAVPAVGLSKPPTHYPASTHVYGLVSHLVYGLTTDLVRRALARAWPAHVRA